ncbi:MAG: RluA family pseudouridine synthase [Flavobacteriales bacterium]|nr:RluA family pseudouridine synthase [Flavobacteriales bacterium]MCB9363944.1 RluA family pseudouridine synthase [Flavobacteriales bacterium]
MMTITKEQFNLALAKVCNPLPGSVPSPTPYKLAVKQKYNGLNIIDFFAVSVPMVSKEKWIEKIENNNLFIDNKPAKFSSKVYGGNITTHFSEPKTEPSVNVNIEFIFCDEHILVLNKPAPLPMHPSGRFNKNSLTEILKLAFPSENFKIIHRLDANTTGVIILGRTNNAVQSISKQFQDKTAKKEYIAMVEGFPTQKYFSSNTQISIEKTPAGGRTISSDGIDAFTEFEVIKTYPEKNITLLAINPHTGRTNQIRLHLAYINHPILGDIGYKDPDYFKNNPLTYSDDCLFLHAKTISFRYHEKEVSFSADLPDKFNLLNHIVT